MIALAFLATGAICFWLGWKGHDWWGRRADEKVIQMFKPKFTAFGVAYFAMFALFIGAFTWSEFRTDNKVNESEERQNDRNTIQLACVSRTFEDFLNGNQKLRDASAKRDDALLGSKKALRELIRLRVIEGVPNSDPAVRQAADQYLVQTQNFIEASQDLNDARQDYKLPDFEKRCGKLQPRIKDVLYRELQEPDWRAQITGTSLD